jgi:hypothetical protein
MKLVEWGIKIASFDFLPYPSKPYFQTWNYKMTEAVVLLYYITSDSIHRTKGFGK